MKKILFFILSLVVVYTSYSQQVDTLKAKSAKFMFSFEPLALSVSSFRINQEFYFSKTNSIVFTEELYAREGYHDMDFFPIFLFNGLDDNDISKVYGFGLGISYKKYLFNKDKMRGFYAGIGFKYTNINLEQETYIYVNEYEYENSIINRNEINSFCTNLNLGVTLSIRDRVFFDFFTGVGLKMSNIDTKGGDAIESYNSIYNYGYSGIIPVLGARIGIKLF